VKHFLGRDLFRIEGALPFLVRISAGTDMDFHKSSPPFFTNPKQKASLAKFAKDAKKILSWGLLLLLN
jgi:hypothetical protein